MIYARKALSRARGAGKTRSAVFTAGSLRRESRGSSGSLRTFTPSSFPRGMLSIRNLSNSPLLRPRPRAVSNMTQFLNRVPSEKTLPEKAQLPPASCFGSMKFLIRVISSSVNGSIRWEGLAPLCKDLKSSSS